MLEGCKSTGAFCILQGAVQVTAITAEIIRHYFLELDMNK